MYLAAEKCMWGGDGNLWLTMSYMRERSVQIGVTASLLVYLKTKGMLEQSNYWGLKLSNYVLKVIERVVKTIEHGIANIDERQFGFCPGWITTDAIFILRQLQE